MEMRMAENVATIMQNMVTSLTSQLEIMAKIPAIRDADPANCNSALEQYYNSFTPRIYNLVRANKDGVYVCAALKELVGQDGTQFPHIVEILKTQKPVISRRFQSLTGNHEWLVAIHVPVFAADGKFVGSLGGAIKLADIYENYLKNNVFAQRGYVIMIDDNGDYLYHPNPEIAAHNVHDEYMTKVLAESKQLQDLVRDYLAGKTGITKYVYLKEWKLAAYAHAQITQDRFWPVVITVPVPEIQGSIKSIISGLQYMYIAVMIVFILLALVIIISLLRRGKTLARQVYDQTRNLRRRQQAILNVLEDVKEERNRAERLAAIVRDSNEAILSKDLDGTILSWNKGATKLYGYSANEAIGRNISFVVPHERMEELNNILKRIARGRSIANFQTIRLRKDKQPVEVAINISPILNPRGKVIGISTIARDITKERAIDKAKTEFVSLASHQLRTPISH